MKEQTCFFTGHRIVADEAKISALLERSIQALSSKGVSRFLCGGAIGFDTLAAEAVLRCKSSTDSGISLILILPCRDQDKAWNKRQRMRYSAVIQSADEVIYTSADYFDGCMHKRNRYMADHSAYCVTYLTQKSGGTYYTANYAHKKGVSFIHLAQLVK